MVGGGLGDFLDDVSQAKDSNLYFTKTYWKHAFWLMCVNKMNLCNDPPASVRPSVCDKL